MTKPNVSYPPPASVYVLDGDQGVKIGITFDVDQRLREIANVSGHAVRLFRSFEVGPRKKARNVEAWAHHELARWRTVGEWFHCHPIEACDTIERIIRWDPAGAPFVGIHHAEPHWRRAA